jgi:hypothetical protein
LVARGKLLPKLEESLLGIRVGLAGKNRFNASIVPCSVTAFAYLWAYGMQG